MKTTLLLALLTLTSCGTPYAVAYIDPATGISAKYSSKGGLAVEYRPLADK